MFFYLLIFVALVLLIKPARRQWLKLYNEQMSKHRAAQKEALNPYINRHKAFVTDNDAHYLQYLKWCEKQEPPQIPMNKDLFIKEVQNKEKYLEDLFNRL
ncbi:hypothetical protein [Flavobacterium coralii]|uniref:hypothetical protein n=1 Tax=Flavobacterium coralii TaxID=2838017 RepID=UPI000C678C58|nr:hypothetical protein [Flavobacterium sp.]|tara:strand:- start:62 stop:361 length:300 start_codon:yes stop_codon:yes gene_type:complete